MSADPVNKFADGPVSDGGKVGLEEIPPSLSGAKAAGVGSGGLGAGWGIPPICEGDAGLCISVRPGNLVEPIRDFRYPFLAHRTERSMTRVRVFCNKAKYVVMFSELKEGNKGVSIRYCLPELATAMKGHTLQRIRLENISWVAHYPRQVSRSRPIPHDVLELVVWFNLHGNPRPFIFPPAHHQDFLTVSELEEMCGGRVEL